MKTLQSSVGAEVIIDGRLYINFGGSSYLGLTSVPEILDAGREALDRYGSGYQFSVEFSIASGPHQQVESEAAAFFGTEAALYLSSGYYFGLIALALMKERFSAVFFDELAHYSLRDGIACSGLPHYAFSHRNSEDLEFKLKRFLRRGERPLIVTDGVYPTFGEIAPLGDFARVMAPYDGRLLVDESHGFGVIGDLGRGANEYHDIPGASVVIGGSTGKGLGVLGGIIPASAHEVAAFRSSPACRGASVGLPAAAAMCAASLRYVRRHPELQQRLRTNTAYMKNGLRRIGLTIADGPAPVATFALSSGSAMQGLQERLMAEEGILLLHTTYIGAGDSGVIRCAVFADHTTEHMDRLFGALRRLL